MKTDTLSVVYSCDNNYAQHMSVSIYSLLVHNLDFKHIQIYIIDNQISEINKEKIQRMIGSFKNTELIWIDFTKWKALLNLKMEWEVSISSYGRLFISSMIPLNIERIIYLDCDMIICDSLKELWNFDLKGNVIGAVQDAVNDETKGAVGIPSEQPYFNAGMLLIDVKKWRVTEAEKMAINFIFEHQGKIKHHDQGVLNGILKNKWMRVPVRYNLMTIHYIYNRSKVMKYFQNHAEFYTEDELEKSRKKPAVLHYTPSFTTRPWVKNCKHPLKEKYWKILQETPWKGAKEENDNRKLYIKLIEWRYRCLPF